MRYAAVIVAALAFAVALAGCGKTGGGSTSTTSSTTTQSASDRTFFARDVKFALLAELAKRGANNPVAYDPKCKWSSPTVAVCTTVSFDEDEADGQCGSGTLPCGRSVATIQAVCARADGGGCTLKIAFKPLDG